MAGGRLVEAMLSSLHSKSYTKAASLAQLVQGDVRKQPMVGGARDRLASETLAVAAMALAEQALRQLHGALAEILSPSAAAQAAVAQSSGAPHVPSAEAARGAAKQHVRTLYRACTYARGAPHTATAWLVQRIGSQLHNMRELMRQGDDIATQRIAPFIHYVDALVDAVAQLPVTADAPSDLPKPTGEVASDASSNAADAVVIQAVMQLRQQAKKSMPMEKRESLSSRLVDIERQARQSHNEFFSFLKGVSTATYIN